jgi:hypothetical protein
MDITNPNPFPNPNSRLLITMEGHAHFCTSALYQTPQLLEGTGIMRKCVDNVAINTQDSLVLALTPTIPPLTSISLTARPTLCLSYHLVHLSLFLSFLLLVVLSLVYILASNALSKLIIILFVCTVIIHNGELSSTESKALFYQFSS